MGTAEYHEPSEEAGQPEAESYVVDTVDQAIERALYGDGVAIIESLGTDEADRQRITARLQSLSPNTSEFEHSRGVRYYYGFEPELFGDLLSPVLDAAQTVPDEAAIVNSQVNEYLPGVELAEHYDFGDETQLYPSGHDVENLTFIWVLDGTKDIVVWPKQRLSDKVRPERITQHPDMLIVLRGGAFEHQDTLYPAIRHGVPAVDDASMIFTFELALPSEDEPEESPE